MSEICCDLCAYWLPQFKECGNTHINKCTNKEYFVKVERNCGTCEREIKAKVIDEFTEQLKSDEFQKYNLDMVFETSRDLSYSQCIDAFHKYIDEIAKQMKEGINNE